MAQVLQPSTHPIKGTIPVGNNSGNALLNSGPKTFNNKSFTQEFTQVKADAAKARENDNIQLAINNQEPILETPVISNPIHKAMSASGLIQESDLKSEFDQRKLIENKEERQEIQEHIFASEEKKDSQEIQNKYISTETQKAETLQSNQQQVVNAVREGNVAQQEARQENSNERKKQLANWEDLAPRIMEDPVNRAIRIDLPGLNDIETLIVKMNKGDAVSIQIVGSKETMQQLKSGEAELSRRLRGQDIRFESLQAFDSEAVKKDSKRAD